MPIVATIAALVVIVSAQPDVSPALVDRTINEADAIWQPADLSLAWSRAVERAPSAVHVVLGTARGIVNGGEVDRPLGWITFEGGQPLPEIYVSFTNVVALLTRSSGLVGELESMPRLQRETYLGRAMGRALAHELGHYLLGTSAHTARGLMKGRPTAYDLFAPSRRPFETTTAQRAQAQVRLDAELAATTGATIRHAQKVPVPDRAGVLDWRRQPSRSVESVQGHYAEGILRTRYWRRLLPGQLHPVHGVSAEDRQRV